jgi:hypothetical protein
MVWATSGNLRFTFYLLTILRPIPKTRSTNEGAFELVSGADVLRNLHYLSKPDPFYGLPGPAVGPGGQNMKKNQGPD